MSDSYKVYASKEYVDSKIAESRVQPDWNQNDPSAADYVKNRTHYEAIETVTLVDNVSVAVSGNWSAQNAFQMNGLIAGEDCIVTVDGVEYALKIVDCSGVSGWEKWCFIGNLSFVDSAVANLEGSDTSAPFVIGWQPANNTTMLYHQTDGTHTVSIAVGRSVCHPLDPKFINSWDAVIEWAVDSDVATLPEDDAISDFKDSTGLYDKLMPIIQAGNKPKILLRGERNGNIAFFIEPFLVNTSDSDEDGENDRIYLYVFEDGMHGIKARYIIIAPSGITAVGTTTVI